MIPDYIREEQAMACLESAAHHQRHLLAVAVKLAGSAEGGMDLYQQTLLNCHDAIQRNGFAGNRYEFYLLTSIRQLHWRQAKAARRSVTLTEQHVEGQANSSATADEQAHLATQLGHEIRERFESRDRVLLRLHVEGHSYREIAAMVGGKDYSWISRRVERMKQALRQTFAQAWASLGE